jgi:hypothetical protein
MAVDADLMATDCCWLLPMAVDADLMATDCC